MRLRECLVSDPNSLLKGYALNNLAIASWFHKSPNPNSILKEEFKEEEYSYSDIDKDYSNVPHLLKRSIRNLEDNENMSYLDWLLDE